MESEEFSRKIREFVSNAAGSILPIDEIQHLLEVISLRSLKLISPDTHSCLSLSQSKEGTERRRQKRRTRGKKERTICLFLRANVKKNNFLKQNAFLYSFPF